MYGLRAMLMGENAQIPLKMDVRRLDDVGDGMGIAGESGNGAQD